MEEAMASTGSEELLSEIPSSVGLERIDEDEMEDSPRPSIAGRTKRRLLAEAEGGGLADSPLLGYVMSAHKSSPRQGGGGRYPGKKLTKTPSIGYIDAGAEELGAVPMRGKHRHDWLKVQANTFTNWVNDRLSGSRSNYSGALVHDLKTDFQDGILIIKLLEALTGKKIQGVVRDPIFTAQKISNLDQSFAFMQEEGVYFTAIGSQNIYEGNLKLIMGLIWTLIQHYQIMRRNTKVSAKELMLNWMQSLLPNSKISNFSSNWRDGRALLSLIHEIKPEKAPPVSSLDPRKNLSNCTLAIRTAKIYLKVPPIISPEDLVSGEIDELSMMTYISYFVKPASKAVLKWVNEVLPQMKITNLTTDWNNGIALAGLLNNLFPGLFPKWKSLSPEKGEENIQRVFDIAKAKCGIEPNLSAREMTDPSIEELHMMTYILRMRSSNLLSLPEHIDISGLGIKEAKLGRQTHFFINTTQAGSGDTFVSAFYEDETGLKFSQVEKRPGILKVIYTPEKSGKLHFNILWSGVPVPGSPFLVSVSDTNAVRVLEREDIDTTIHVQSPVVIKVDATAMEHGSLTARLMYTDSPPLIPEVTSDSRIYTVQFVPVTVGMPTLRFYWDKEELKNCSIEFTILDTRQYHISHLPKKSQYYTFDPIRFVVESREGLPLHPLKMPVLKVQGSTARYPVTLEEKSPQEYLAHFIPWELGAHDISITLGGFPIPGTPCEFNAVTSASTTCSATGSGLQRALTSIPAQFLVQATSGLLEEGNLSIQVQSVVSGYYGKVRVRDNENSSYNVAYLVDTPGAYLVHVKAWDQHIPGSPFKVNVSYGPQAHNCILSGKAVDPNFFVKIGDPIEFSVDGRKAGNGMLNVSAVGPRGAQARVFTAKGSRSGLYDVQLDPIRPGKYRVSVKWSGEHIPNSPFLVKIFPGADASKCRAYGPGLEDGMVGKPSTFTIETRDAGSGVLKVRLNGLRNAFKVDVKPVSTQNMRTLVAKYNPTKPGDYLISIKWSEVDVPGSPFKVRIGGEEIVNREQNHRTSESRLTELETIQEEYQQTESQFSLEDWTKKQRHYNHRQQQPLLPAHANFSSSMPKFGQGHGISYQSNFATRGGIASRGGAGVKKSGGSSKQTKKHQQHNGRSMSNGTHPKKSTLKK
uniref:Calponin-homology (CH) domain-containing protein n=1 Tax=Amphimedon queenslandica TaxID=400682 RepID=A0A1X7V5N3_AMPQE